MWLEAMPAEVRALEVTSTKYMKTHLVPQKPAKEQRKANSVAAGTAAEIGRPYNVSHNVHVDFNPEVGYQGLPPEWRAMLLDSGISAEEVMRHPQEVADVINFQLERQRSSQKHLRKSRSLEFETATKSSFESYQDLSSSDDDSESRKSVPRAKGKGQGRAPGGTTSTVELGELISRENPKLEYSQLQKIGEGASGTVHRAQTSLGEIVAVKIVPLITSTNMKVIKNEISIMKTCCHPNIVTYMNSYLSENSLWVR